MAKLAEAIAAFDIDATPTTVIIRHLPCRLDLLSLASALDTLGFAQRYDFLYLVGGHRCSRPPQNLGYAFVNFPFPGDAEAFAVAFGGFRFKGFCSVKKGIAEVAQVQGVESCLQKVRRSSKGRVVKGSMLLSL